MTNFIFVVIIAIIIILIASAMISSSNNKPKISISFDNYIKTGSILSEAEFNFFNVLSLALHNSGYIICPKVRIADFVQVKGNENRLSKFNKISGKHVDFLICNKKLSPIIAIELDDKSHNKQLERDNFVNELYKSINLPILRIKNGQSYSVMELREKIKEII